MSFGDIIIEEDFFNRKFINNLWQECLTLDHLGKDFVDHYGIWKGKTITRQNIIRHSASTVDLKDFSDLLPLMTETVKKVSEYFENNIVVREIAFQQLYLPWDIHCDLTREDLNKKNIYENSHSDSYVPFYNILIPLHDVDSRTIIFNETSTEYNDFWKYKKDNPKSKNPVDEKIWKQYLDMCWAEDREWLSIKEILPSQKSGQMLAFRRHFFHSSDNFHQRGVKSKHFIQLLLDKKC